MEGEGQLSVKYILGLETSCDETAAAVLDNRRRLLASVVLTQDAIHAPYGGVVPELASRQHLAAIVPVVGQALERAGISLERIDAYAVTQGPGLIGSLLVGLSFAKTLAYYFRRPLVGVDHVEAHIEAAFLENPGLPLPAVALVVSGGHTSLFFLKKRLDYRLLGRTRDDAAGEALDKIAKFLGLGYPGGPVIEKMGRSGDATAFPFARPRMKDESLDFSFSGIKTAALRLIEETGMSASHPRLTDFLASFEDAVVRALLDNLGLAAEKSRPASLILGGGVARNSRLRHGFEELARSSGYQAFVPSPGLCTDNAVMVAALGLVRLQAGTKKKAPLDLDAYPRFNAPRE